MPVTIQRKAASAVETPRSDGVYVLEAACEWFVQGIEAEIDAVVAALGESVSTRLLPTVAAVWFGNSVGCFDGGPLGPIRVVNGGLAEGHFDALLDRVAQASAALPFAARTPAQVEMSAGTGDSLLFHAFAVLRRAMRPDAAPRDGLLPALERIIRHPHRRLRRQGRIVDASQARRIEPSAIEDLLAARWPLVRAAGGSPVVRALRGHAPTLVEETVAEETIDTAENRFVKAHVSHCLAVVAAVREALAERPSPSTTTRLKRELDRMEAALLRISRHGVWTEVGRLRHFPSQSTVLHGDTSYRVVLQNHVRMQLGARLRVGDDPWRALIEVKDIDLLYEIWTFLAVAESVTRVCGPPLESLPLEDDPLQQRVRWGTALRFRHGVHLVYNPTFSRPSKAPPPGAAVSWSLQLRPDLVLEVPGPDGAAVRHILDAKLKADWVAVPMDADEQSKTGTVKTVDLQKMHTYLDAITGARTAWVLYPGHAFRFLGRQLGPEAVAGADVPASPRGIGAIPLPLDGRGVHLDSVIARLLGVG